MHQITQTLNEKCRYLQFTAVNKKEVLLEANKLVSNCLRKAAIDLLLEYLESDPDSPHVLRTLGRTYILNRQPVKAVICLKRSLKVKQSNCTKKKFSSRYQSDDFDDDDMDFVESQAENFSEEDYNVEDVESIQPATNKETQSNSDDSEVPSSEHSDWNKTLKETPEPILPHANKKSSHTIPTDIYDSSNHEEKSLPPRPKSDPTVAINPSTLTVDDETTEQQAIDENQYTDWVDDEDLELLENEQLFSKEVIKDDNEDLHEEDLDGLGLMCFPSVEEEYDEDELNWDDYNDLDDIDELDDFDELAHRKIEEEVQDEGEISREIRARQIAVEVLDKSDWDLKYLSLLQQIFIENGWSAARRAIERQVDKDLQPEELVLARKIRRFWLGNEQYWMTFQKIKCNAPFQQTDATYKCMSWPESLRIIRCFPSLPDIEEIYAFIDEVFSYWYNSKKLRRIFPVFFKFLKYRVDSMRRALPDETLFSFLYYVNGSSDFDADRLTNSFTPECQDLLELGFQLNQWQNRPQEN